MRKHDSVRLKFVHGVLLFVDALENTGFSVPNGLNGAFHGLKVAGKAPILGAE